MKQYIFDENRKIPYTHVMDQKVDIHVPIDENSLIMEKKRNQAKMWVFWFALTVCNNRRNMR